MEVAKALFVKGEGMSVGRVVVLCVMAGWWYYTVLADLLMAVLSNICEGIKWKGG